MNNASFDDVIVGKWARAAPWPSNIFEKFGHCVSIGPMCPKNLKNIDVLGPLAQKIRSNLVRTLQCLLFDCFIYVFS